MNDTDDMCRTQGWHRLLCLFGAHRRLGRSVHPSVAGYRATCRHCGRAMVRKFDGRWRTARRNDPDA